MSESTLSSESSQPNFVKRRALAGLVALSVVGAGASEVVAQFGGEHGSSPETIKVGEKVDIIPGSVTIPAGINRDSRPAVGHGPSEDYRLYDDREEFVSNPIEVSTPNSPTAERWLTYRNVEGKMVWVAETPDSIYKISVESGNKQSPLAEERIQPGGVVETTIRSVGPDGFTASTSDVAEPMPIAIIEDRN